jgi:hypothetical protein
LKGNLHGHSTRSDGARAPQAVIDDYADREYDFLMMSDHDKFADENLLREWDNRGMVMLPGNEITAGGVHMLQIGGSHGVEPLPDRQATIDNALAAGSVVVVNHPNWHEGFNHCRQEQMAAWTGYAGLEIYNGVIGRLHGSPYATNHWDMLLTAGRRVWGFANDDSHAAVGDVGLGWNMVDAPDRSAKSIIAALAAGRFYASTGVTILDIRVEGLKVTIETADAERIVALRDTARRVKVVDDRTIEVEAGPDWKYLRFECWGRGEQFAWTQPFIIQA